MKDTETRRRGDAERPPAPLRVSASPPLRVLPSRRSFLWTGLLFIPTLTRAQFAPSAGERAAILGLPPAGGGGGCAGTTKDSQTGATNNLADNDAYKWIAGNFTAGSTYTLCKLTMRMSKTGTPAGTITAAIYSDAAGNVPGSQVGTASDAVTATTLATGEGNVDFVNLSASLTSGTVYHIVLKCSSNGDASNKVNAYYSFDGDATHEINLSDNSGSSWDNWTDSNQIKFTSYS